MTSSSKAVRRSSRNSLQVMGYTGGFGLLLIILFSCMLCITSQPLDYSCANSSSGVAYTTNSSKYVANLDILLLSLTSNANSTTGFYSNSVGIGSDKIYGSFLCRGDITPEECQNCVENGTRDIKPSCPNKTTAIVWYNTCMVRYSNQPIFSILQQQPVIFLYDVNNVTQLDQYNTTVEDFMLKLLPQAAYGVSTAQYYATGKMNYSTGNDTVYGLVQCTPYITPDECYSCLRMTIMNDISSKFYPRMGGRILKPSCNLRFEFNNAFYDRQVSSTPATTTHPSTPATTPSTNTTLPAGLSANLTILVFVVVVGTIITLLIIASLYPRFARRQKPKVYDEDSRKEITCADFFQYNLDTIKAATDNFSDENKLGQGGFGAVYKGFGAGILVDGQVVAVKRFSKYSGQGETEFKNEVILMAKLQYRNLVRLLGFCLKGEEKLLIHEFVPNTSLDHFIFEPIKCSELDWEGHFKIIEGFARGILYLHEDSRVKIIHQDLKASNILLDKEMNPKTADFGMAKLFVVDQTQANTSRIVGTYSYMAPEYITQGQFSAKTDVFSFGVLLLEIISGQKNCNFNHSGSMEDGLLSYAWRKWTEGAATALIDTTMQENCPTSEVIGCIHIGLLCVQENVSNKPTMATVFSMLNSYSATLPLPSSAAFVMINNEFEFGEPTTESDSEETRSGQSTNSRIVTLVLSLNLPLPMGLFNQYNRLVFIFRSLARQDPNHAFIPCLEDAICKEQERIYTVDLAAIEDFGSMADLEPYLTLSGASVAEITSIAMVVLSSTPVVVAASAEISVTTVVGVQPIKTENGTNHLKDEETVAAKTVADDRITAVEVSLQASLVAESDGVFKLDLADPVAMAKIHCKKPISGANWNDTSAAPPFLKQDFSVFLDFSLTPPWPPPINREITCLIFHQMCAQGTTKIWISRLPPEPPPPSNKIGDRGDSDFPLAERMEFTNPTPKRYDSYYSK
ncbi:cysteine-rich receptor-like protein kinase 10 [Telopea speciosissima]|uniref:cysteine-rich receptor-like protein kinase 10 n=1 Tax=Telopea speciosissima TaxID=54955 RepID=UPI001CC33D3C|nr:cysteine-rich receptor-like protein kinase 10 [Telopea speciosissima]